MTWNPLRARRDRDFRRIAAVFLALPHDDHFGLDLCRRAGVGSGSLYPILGYLERQEWIVADWETDVEERRPRRYYAVTGRGLDPLAAILRGDQEVPR